MIQSSNFVIVLIFLTGCAVSTSESSIRPKDATMNPPTLWQALISLSKKYPFTREKIESVLPVQFNGEVIERNEYWNSFVGKNILLADGVIISKIEFSYKKNNPARTEMLLDEMVGPCVTQRQVEDRYGALIPYGEGVNYYLYKIFTTWGQLEFAFHENAPYCLISVGFRMNPEKSA